MNWTQQDVDDLERRRKFPHVEKIAPAKSRSHGSHTPGQMNKTEARFAQYLDLLVKAGQISAWFFEQVTLKLGADCRFTADFCVIATRDEPPMFYEVKARRKFKLYATDDAKVKIKVAASMFPWRFFYAFPNQGNGDWELIEVPRL